MRIVAYSSHSTALSKHVNSDSQKRKNKLSDPLRVPQLPMLLLVSQFIAQPQAARRHGDRKLYSVTACQDES
jgi:hypothetical protein